MHGTGQYRAPNLSHVRAERQEHRGSVEQFAQTERNAGSELDSKSERLARGRAQGLDQGELAGSIGESTRARAHAANAWPLRIVSIDAGWASHANRDFAHRPSESEYGDSTAGMLRATSEVDAETAKDD